MVTYPRIAIVTLALLGLALALPDPKPVEIRTRHAFISSSDVVRWQVRVEPDDRNRSLDFLAIDRSDGEVVSRSYEALDGDKAPITRWFSTRLPVGDLLLVANLVGLNGRHASDTKPVCVYDLHRSCGSE